MKSENILVKFIFGLVIFAFALAFAYFSASYVKNGNIFDYWLTLAIASIAYVLVGVIVSKVFSISLGFLFAADVLILHVLLEEYDGVSDIYKTLLVGVILATLYFFAWKGLRDPLPVPIPPSQTGQI